MGGGKTSTPPAAPIKSAEEIAAGQTRAMVESIPRAAELQHQVETSPVYGIEAKTRLAEQTRQNVFPNEQAVRQQLVQNILANLISPTGISPEQQTALTARRGQAQGELEQSMRTRANLGGGLFGGRSSASEARSIGEQFQNFAIEDIDRQERARMNALSAALPVLQLLFPDIGLIQPSFINPVASPESQLSAYTTGRGQDLTYQAQQEANQTALRSALYQSLGGAVGQVGGGGGTGGLSLGGGIAGTVGNTGKTQSQILGYNTAQYR